MMFYRPADGHGLPHNPFNAIVSPRPIGWISTRSAEGHDNLAPYSFFNAVAYEPPQVMFASSGRKDTLNNVEQTGVFCVNIVGAEAAHIMNLSSAALAHHQDEFAHSGAMRAECGEIACARVSDALPLWNAGSHRSCASQVPTITRSSAKSSASTCAMIAW